MASIKFHKTNKKKFGNIAEFVACLYLKLKLYKILHRNIKNLYGEVDIIARKGDTIVFVEVKARSRKENLFDILTKTQQQRIINSAKIFMSKNNRLNGMNVRFDLIIVSRFLIPKHITNAWQDN